MTPELKNALTTMASAGDVDEMRTQLTAAQEPPSEETIQNLLTAAAKSSHLNVVKFLLTQYPSVPLEEDSVRAAVNQGSIPILEALLARDPSLINMAFDKRGSPLIVACMGRQKIEYLQFLLKAGADPNQDPDAAMYPLALVAGLYKDPDVIDLLLQYGARMEHSGALAAAISRGNEPMLQRLLDRGAQLDVDNASSRPEASPLNLAVRRGHAGVVRILLQHGADPNATDSSGATAIEVAKQMRSKGEDMSEMLEILGGK